MKFLSRGWYLSVMLVGLAGFARGQSEPSRVAVALTQLESNYTARAEAASKPVWREYLTRLEALRAQYLRVPDSASAFAVLQDINKVRDHLGMEPLPESPSAATPAPVTPATPLANTNRSLLSATADDATTRQIGTRVKPDSDGSFVLQSATGRFQGRARAVENVVRMKPGSAVLTWKLSGAKPGRYRLVAEYALEGTATWFTYISGNSHETCYLAPTDSLDKYTEASSSLLVSSPNAELDLTFDGYYAASVNIRKITLTPVR